MAMYFCEEKYVGMGLWLKRHMAWKHLYIVPPKYCPVIDEALTYEHYIYTTVTLKFWICHVMLDKGNVARFEEVPIGGW
ncbi:hypothetical protein Tco_1397606, partial [Tanacetum coccineum]